MTDLIDRQAAIDALKACRDIFCDNTPYTFSALPFGEKCRVDEIDNAIAILVNLPSAQQWIPASEKKPENYKIVLTCSSKWKYHIGFRYDDSWLFNDIDMKIREKDILPFVWMPLPEPWKGWK